MVWWCRHRRQGPGDRATSSATEPPREPETGTGLAEPLRELGDRATQAWHTIVLSLVMLPFRRRLWGLCGQHLADLKREGVDNPELRQRWTEGSHYMKSVKGLK